MHPLGDLDDLNDFAALDDLDDLDDIEADDIFADAEPDLIIEGLGRFRLRRRRRRRRRPTGAAVARVPRAIPAPVPAPAPARAPILAPAPAPVLAPAPAPAPVLAPAPAPAPVLAPAPAPTPAPAPVPPVEPVEPESTSETEETAEEGGEVGLYADDMFAEDLADDLAYDDMGELGRFRMGRRLLRNRWFRPVAAVAAVPIVAPAAAAYALRRRRRGGGEGMPAASAPEGAPEAAPEAAEGAVSDLAFFDDLYTDDIAYDDMGELGNLRPKRRRCRRCKRGRIPMYMLRLRNRKRRHPLYNAPAAPAFGFIDGPADTVLPQRIAPAGSRLLAPTSALPPWAWRSRQVRLGAGRIVAQQIPPWQDGTTNFSYFRNYMNPYLNPHLFGLDDLGSTTGSARIPWLWILGAAIIGFLGCRLLQRKNK